MVRERRPSLTSSPDFIRPPGERFIFQGEDITNLKPYAIAHKGIARTFQLTAVFSRDTVFDNLVVGHRLRVKAGLLGTIFGSRRTREEERAMPG